MEREFNIEQLKHKNDPKLEETIIVKICKKKEVEDNVFSDKLIDRGPLIVDKTNDKFDRDYVLNRLHKIINGESVEDFRMVEEEKEDVVAEEFAKKLEKQKR